MRREEMLEMDSFREDSVKFLCVDEMASSGFRRRYFLPRRKKK